MARTEGRTCLVVGPRDVDDLLDALDVAIAARDNEAQAPRLRHLQRRLIAAASRLERGRNGRAGAAA